MWNAMTIFMISMKITTGIIHDVEELVARGLSSG